MKKNMNPVRGMKDYLPNEALIREKVRNIITRNYTNAGFSKIETPALENLDILLGGDGGENEKLIYKILKRGDKLKKAAGDLDKIADLGLRYDLTVPLSRYYANNKNNLELPFKVLQMGSVWRAERPQKGRYRQFEQCDIDIIGEKSSYAEIDLLANSAKTLLDIGFKNFTYRINDRRILEALAEYSGFSEDQYSAIFITIDKLDKIGITGIEQELRESNFDNKSVEKLLAVVKNFTSETFSLKMMEELLAEIIDPQIIEELEHIIATVKEISKNDFQVVYDPTLVRGMGYYTGPIYEISYKNYNGSIGGGGRYDKMLGKRMNQDLAACGISFGLDRLCEVIEADGIMVSKSPKKIALISSEPTQNLAQVYQKAAELEGIVSILPREKKLGKQLKRLKENGFDYYMIYQENELKELE